MLSPLARAACLLAFVGLSLPSCSTQSLGQKLVTLMPGVVNDPKNRTLRRELLRYGSTEFCKELTRRGAPLKLRDEEPAVGRFFVDQCSYQELDNDDAFVQFSGAGYAWTQPTGRVGFRAGAAIVYNPDFLLDSGTMYAYFRPRTVQSTKFEPVMVERRGAADLAGALLGEKMETLAARLGAQIVAQELSRGFTVLRDEDGSTDFGLGIIDKGKRPFHPYQVKGSDKLLLASDTSEVHVEQREFLGPFVIEDDKRALYFMGQLDGAQALDLFVMRKEDGEAWARDFIFKPGLTPLPGKPLVADVLPGGREYRKVVPLSKGAYYIVLDHSGSAGTVNPPPAGTGLFGATDLAGVVRYVAQVGDAP